VAFWFTPDLLTATAPILAGLILAVPLTMLGAHKVAGLGVKSNGLFMTPEERRPPAIVRAALGPACEPPVPLVQPPAGPGPGRRATGGTNAA
jgi:membrane glycosyltransferase